MERTSQATSLASTQGARSGGRHVSGRSGSQTRSLSSEVSPPRGLSGHPVLGPISLLALRRINWTGPLVYSPITISSLLYSLFLLYLYLYLYRFSISISISTVKKRLEVTFFSFVYTPVQCPSPPTSSVLGKIGTVRSIVRVWFKLQNPKISHPSPSPGSPPLPRSAQSPSGVPDAAVRSVPVSPVRSVAAAPRRFSHLVCPSSRLVSLLHPSLLSSGLFCISVSCNSVPRRCRPSRLRAPSLPRAPVFVLHPWDRLRCPDPLSPRPSSPTSQSAPSRPRHRRRRPGGRRCLGRARGRGRRWPARRPATPARQRHCPTPPRRATPTLALCRSSSPSRPPSARQID